MKKKAQVTIFMIIGLIILVTVLVFFFIQKSAFEDSAEQIIKKQKPEFAGQTEINYQITRWLYQHTKFHTNLQGKGSRK